MLKANSFERYMQQLVNQERAKAGMGPVKLELNLNQSAQNHSKWMLATDTFSHTGARGSSAHERMVASNFDFSGAAGSAENLSIQTMRGAPGIKDDVYDLHVSLMNSPGHRANILNPKYDYVGISIETGNFDYGGQTAPSVIVTQNFAYTGGSVDLDRVGGSGSGASGNGGNSNGGGYRADGKKVFGSGRDEKIVGTNRDDMLVGRGGDDKIAGRQGNDVLNGGGGHDKLFGHAGHDKLVGAGGKDKLFGHGGNDKLFGGGGADLLVGHGGADLLAGGGANDILVGGPGNDILKGGTGRDILNGGTGHDRLFGGGGNDKLSGKGGKDRLDGGAGDDILRGGGGADTFVFRKNSGIDRILDFRPGQDTLDLSGIGFSSVSDAIQSARVAGNDVVFKLGGGNAVRLENVSLDAVTDDILV